MNEEKKAALAASIDHTILKAEASEAEVFALCEEAKTHGFASVCAHPIHAKLLAEALEGSPVKRCVVIGFPLGAHSTAVKKAELLEAKEAGANEFDMVLRIDQVKAANYEAVEEEIRVLVEAAKPYDLKVILECCLLSKTEIQQASQAAVQAGAAFVKTSTGFSTGGATLEDVRLMKEAVAGRAKVKASGGIRDQETALAMLEAGAERIGASAGLKIIGV